MCSKSKGLLATAVAVCLFGYSASSYAASFPSLISGANTASDDNRERLINNVGDANVIDVGDVLRGVLAINQLFNDKAPPAGHLLGGTSGNDELTAIFHLLVTGKAEPLPGTFTFTFGPDPAFAAEFGAAPGTMVLVYTDPSNNMRLDRNPDSSVTTIALSEASATDGSLVWTLGFTGPGGTPVGGEGYSGIGGDTITAFNAGTQTGFANFALNRTSNDGILGDLGLVPQTSIFGGTAEFIGSASIRGTQNLGGTPWQLSSDTTITFVIPLPASVWGGAGLLSLLAGAKCLRWRRAA